MHSISWTNFNKNPACLSTTPTSNQRQRYSIYFLLWRCVPAVSLSYGHSKEISVLWAGLYACNFKSVSGPLCIHSYLRMFVYLLQVGLLLLAARLLGLLPRVWNRAACEGRWRTLDLMTGRHNIQFADCRNYKHRRQPRRGCRDVSPPIFWLAETSMGMSPPIFGVAM